MDAGFWGRAQPPAGVNVDRSHPLAKGLVSCVPCNTGAAPRDLAHARSLNTGGAFGPSRRGAVCRDWKLNYGSPDLDFLAGGWTVAALFEQPNVHAGAADNPAVFGTEVYVTGTNNQGWAIEINTANLGKYNFLSFRNSAVATDSLGGTSANTAGVHMVVGTSDGVTRRIYVDGQFEASTTNNANPLVVAAGSTLYNVSSGSSPLVYIGYAWNRCLSPQEAMQLWIAPYGMFAAPPWRRYFVPRTPYPPFPQRAFYIPAVA